MKLNPMKFRVILFLFSLGYNFELLACEPLDWLYSIDIYAPLKLVDSVDIEEEFVNYLKVDFKARSPRNMMMTELWLNRVYFNLEDKTRMYLFNLIYVEDIGFIYVVDEENSIVSKHVYSYWDDRGEREETLFLRGIFN